MAEYFYGTNGNDYIKISVNGAVAYGYSGNDSIYNDEHNDVTIYGGDGADSVKVWYSDNMAVYGGNGSDKISLRGNNAVINGDAGEDILYVNGSYASVSGGDGADNIESYSSGALLKGGNGNDYIYNSGANSYVYGDSGNDKIKSYGTNVKIYGGADNDSLYIDENDNGFIDGGAGNDTLRFWYGTNVSLKGGTGNDLVSLHGGSYFVQYASGDGNDVIYGFNSNSTLNISGSKYSTAVSDKDVIVTVGKDKITLVDAANLSNLNIKGTSGSSSGGNSSGGTSGGTSKKVSIPAKALRYKGHSYYIFNDGMTWEEAKAYCKVRGGHLVAITSANEQNAVQSLLPSKSVKNGYWMGGYKDGSNSWTWITGETWNYENFDYNEPNGSGNCLQMYGLDNQQKGKWDDTTNDLSTAGVTTTVQGFICEWDTVSSSTKNGINLYNDTAKKKITGTSSADSIRNSAFKVKISTSAGNDKIYNEFGNNTSINAGTGNDSIYNRSFYTTIIGGDGKDTVYNENGEWASINTGNGNDSIYNVSNYDDDGHYVTISSGAGNDKIKNEFGDHSKIIAGSGKDSIYNRSFYTTINGGDDNDTITVFESGWSSINGGSGNDRIRLTGNDVNASSYVSVKGGKGNDSLWGSSGSETFIYGKGDGKDVIYGFENNDLLQITGAFSAKYNKSKKEVAFKVGSGSVTLKDFGSTTLFHVNDDIYQLSNGKLSKK